MLAQQADDDFLESTLHELFLVTIRSFRRIETPQGRRFIDATL
jgi:hypothetical protein